LPVEVLKLINLIQEIKIQELINFKLFYCHAPNLGVLEIVHQCKNLALNHEKSWVLPLDRGQTLFTAGPDYVIVVIMTVCGFVWRSCCKSPLLKLIHQVGYKP
jgi:hypothetical protein